MIITKGNEPIYRKANGTYLIRHPATGEVNYWCGSPDDPDGCHAEAEAYLADHPDALQPEPTPPAPTPEQLKEREIAEKLACLRDTDWYVVRYAETGVAIPVEVSAARSAARARIDELR